MWLRDSTNQVNQSVILCSCKEKYACRSFRTCGLLLRMLISPPCCVASSVVKHSWCSLTLIQMHSTKMHRVMGINRTFPSEMERKCSGAHVATCMSRPVVV